MRTGGAKHFGKLNQQGLTLVEMIAVLGIISLIIAFTIPRMGPTPGLRLDADSKKIDALSQLARAEAVATGEPRRIAFVTESSDSQLSQNTIFLMKPYFREETEEIEWIISSAPEFFGTGVFLDPVASSGFFETDFKWNETEIKAFIIEFHPSGLCVQEDARLHLALGIRNDDGIDFFENEGNRSELLFTRRGAVLPAIETL